MDKTRRKPMKETNLNATVLTKPTGSKYHSKLNETIAFGKNATGIENSSKLKPSSFKKGSFLLPPAPQFNETVVKGKSEDGLTTKSKPSSGEKLANQLPPSVTKTSQLKLDFVYDDYLQTLVKQSLVHKQIAENKTVLDGQLRYYSTLMNKKQQNFREVHNHTELIKKQSEIIELLKYLEEKLENANFFFIDHQLEKHMDMFKTVLDQECNKIFLKNIKVDEDKLLDILKILRSTIDKIISSGVDFEEIHDYAEKIRNFLQLRDNARDTQNTLKKMETEGIKILLKKLSDMFAKQYD